MDMTFEGPSANYIRQQVELCLKPLEPLKRLGGDAEAQALLALGSAITSRISELRRDAGK